MELIKYRETIDSLGLFRMTNIQYLWKNLTNEGK